MDFKPLAYARQWLQSPVALPIVGGLTVGQTLQGALMSSVKRIAWPVVAVLAFAAGFAWPMATAQEPNGAVQKWEYRLVTTHDELRLVNELGNEGWELVTVVGGGRLETAYMKRKK